MRLKVRVQVQKYNIFILFIQDETFPELGVGSVEGVDDQESVCSSNEREGDAFPKAFDRDLVTPTNLQKAAQSAAESADNATANSATADKSVDKCDTDTKDNTNTNECKFSILRHMILMIK